MCVVVRALGVSVCGCAIRVRALGDPHCGFAQCAKGGVSNGLAQGAESIDRPCTHRSHAMWLVPQPCCCVSTDGLPVAALQCQHPLGLMCKEKSPLRGQVMHTTYVLVVVRPRRCLLCYIIDQGWAPRCVKVGATYCRKRAFAHCALVHPLPTVLPLCPHSAHR